MTEPLCAHPSDEWLVAYLTRGLPPDERQGIDDHLEACDLCIGTLTTMQRRLALAPGVAVPVPAAVAACAAPAPPSMEAPADLRPAWWSMMLDRLGQLVRLPVLVPVAVAATAVLVLVSHSDITIRAPHPQTRAVDVQQMLPITAPEAAVWPRPNPSGAGEDRAITTVTRGTKLAVIGEVGDWYRVTLPDGRTGWVERHAFE